jgi:hypothetical protein
MESAVILLAAIVLVSIFSISAIGFITILRGTKLLDLILVVSWVIVMLLMSIYALHTLGTY